MMIIEEKISNYCDYIINEYINAGGEKDKADRSLTYWTLRGIYDREGEKSLDVFVENWKPYVAPKRSVGYAGI